MPKITSVSSRQSYCTNKRGSFLLDHGKDAALSLPSPNFCAWAQNIGLQPVYRQGLYVGKRTDQCWNNVGFKVVTRRWTNVVGATLVRCFISSPDQRHLPTVCQSTIWYWLNVGPIHVCWLGSDTSSHMWQIIFCSVVCALIYNKQMSRD